MKKLALPFIFCVSTLFYFSCSSDIDNTTDNQQQESTSFQLKSMPSDSIAVAKRLYADMMQSQPYIDMKTSVRAFNTKIGYNKGVSFLTKAEWMQWINSNISKTNYTSVSQFEYMYNDFVNKSTIVRQRNQRLFSLLHTAANNDSVYSYIITPELQIVTPQPDIQSACEEACMDACTYNIDVEMEGYRQDLILADVLGSQEYRDMAIRDHDFMMNIIIPADLNLCMMECEQNGGSN